MRQLHVGVAQIQSKVGNPWENLQRMHRQIQAGAAVGVEVMLFAETVIHAYDVSPENLALAEPLGGPFSQCILEWASRYDMVILAGMLERKGEAIHNSQLVAFPDGHLECERKHVLKTAELKAGLTPGPRERTIFNIHDVPCAVLVCADVAIKGVYDELQRRGVEYCFIPTAGGGKRKQYLHASELNTEEGRQRYCNNRTHVFKADAILSAKDSPFPGWASANALGDDGGTMVHQGHCLIVDRDRVVRAQIPGTNVIDHFQDQMAHAVVAFNQTK